MIQLKVAAKLRDSSTLSWERFSNFMIFRQARCGSSVAMQGWEGVSLEIDGFVDWSWMLLDMVIFQDSLCAHRHFRGCAERPTGSQSSEGSTEVCLNSFCGVSP